MDEGLLRTKLFVPPVRPRLVPRPRLLEQLNQGLVSGHRLTLVSAPAGFGKTTLLAGWIRNLPAADGKIAQSAWLSLDENDSDLFRFLAYLITAVQHIEQGTGETALALLRTPRPPPVEAILTPLLNDIAALAARIVLVIDDFHLIDHPDIHHAAGYLIQHLPPQLHLAIVTREDPPLPLARWRAQDQLTEVRALDLRFTPDEVAAFFQLADTPDLSPADIAALETRTEGWIAGLQLAALSLQRSPDVSESVRSFSGSHHFVLDYLVEEVLEQQEEHVQTFLLQTAVLERMNGSLCDALTGRNDGRQILEDLERANLFLVPLDQERQWFRYHHLFADLLRQRLRRHVPSSTDGSVKDTTELYRRASEWHAEHGHVDDAIEYAFRAGEMERAADLIEKIATAARRRGGYSRLRAWLRRLPDEVLSPRPHLALLKAEALIVSGDQKGVDEVLQGVERGLGAEDEAGANEAPLNSSTSNRQKLRGRISVIRAMLAFYRGDAAGVLEHGRRALHVVPDDDVDWRSSAANAVGDAHITYGDMPEALRAHSAALAASEEAGNLYMNMLVGVKMAITLRQMGRLREAVDMCRQQLHLAGEHRLSQSAVAGWATVVWAEVQAERNDLDGALLQAARGLEQIKRAGATGDVAILCWGYLCQIRILFSQGAYARAESLAKEVLQMAGASHVPPWIASRAAAWQARICLIQDQNDAAAGRAALRDFPADTEPTFLNEAELLALGRISLAEGRLDEAAGLLQRLLVAAWEGERSTAALEVLILQARTFHAGQEPERALAALAEAFAFAEPAGFFRIFVDEGPPLVPLLREALARAMAPQYVRRLLAAFPAEGAVPAGPPPISPDPSPLVEPLSERELEVLRKIAEGLTNRQIAQRLYLSLNTVKVHTRNIYGKLCVHSRTQAVARARELGLLAA